MQFAVTDDADRPEGLTREIQIVGPVGHQSLDLAGAGVGGEVQIFVFPPQQGITNGPSDEIERVPGRGKHPRESNRSGVRVEQRLQARRYGLGHFGVISLRRG